LLIARSMKAYMKPQSVGIIANPDSGKDIRRLVAYGSVFNNNEKISIMKRILMALDAMKIKRIFMMPDHLGLGVRALDDLNISTRVDLLDMDIAGNQDDSTRAAAMLDELGVACIITLGGDGTNRVVAKACRDTPILPISTGTNNVFPYMIDGTLAGMTAGVLATHAMTVETMCKRMPKLELYRKSVLVDIALIDIVVTNDIFIGARAVWEVDSIKEIYLARANPASIGFSSIGGLLCPDSLDSGKGVHLFIGKGKLKVLAPIAPGLILSLPIVSYSDFGSGETITIEHTPSVIALDGEREISVVHGDRLDVVMNREGPWVVDIEKGLKSAAEQGIFTVRQII
jgi:predicted polyphosphate/ATP-dependent NAD kinase